MALVILLWLPSFPFTAPFLTTREKAIAVSRLKEHKPKSHGGATGWEGLKLVLLDLGMWMFAVLYCSCEFPAVPRVPYKYMTLNFVVILIPCTYGISRKFGFL